MPSFRMIAMQTIAGSGLAIMLAVQTFLLPTPAARQTFPTLTSAVDAIGLKYKVYLGLEYAPRDLDRTPIALDLSADNVDSVLSELVAQKPEYQWAMKDGVYDIYPKQNPDSLLDTQIQLFSVKNASGKRASEAIDEIPEVRLWFAKKGATRRELELGAGNEIPDVRVSLTLSNVSLRTVLNRLIQLLGHHDWTVVRYGDKQEHIAIYF